MDRPGVRQVPEGSGKQGKMKKTGWKIICAAPTTLAVKGLMIMMMTVLAEQLVLTGQLARFVGVLTNTTVMHYSLRDVE